MLTDISQFIAAGWHTIPHTSPNIVRDPSTGQKKFGLPKGWDRYKEEFNEVTTAVGSVIPGPESNLIVVDCDSTETTELFEQLLPSYKAVTYGIDKTKNIKTIVEGKETIVKQEIRSSNWFFYYTPNIPVIHNGLFSLEVFSGEGDIQQVFLPTKGNTTKTTWEELPPMQEMPESILTLLSVWKKASSAPSPIARNNTNASQGQHTFQLAPLVEKQLVRDAPLPELFSIITPSQFRDNVYKRQGYLHPNDIPDGKGNEYMISVSAMLGSDESISKDLFARIMHYINDLWDNPYSEREISKRIERMTSGEARKNGALIWRYDSQWEHARFMDHNKMEQLVEYFVDPSLLEVVEVNHTTLVTRVLKKGLATALTQLTTKGKEFIGKNKIEKFQLAIPSMSTVVRPMQPFGPLPDNRYEYNIFRASPALEVIREPDTYKEQYTEPTPFIHYMESLVPKAQEREYLLRHLVTKLSTFGYSPAVYYFVGVPGSGKGIFTSLVSKLLGGEQYVGTNLGSSEITGTTNGWLKGLLFAHFDELHDTLGKSEDRKKANGNLKKWSGAEMFQLREMHKDPVPEPMLATFILTQNGSAFNMDVGDRRYLYMNTPNVLKQEIVEGILDLINNNIEDIAYYLVTNYKILSLNDYVRPPMTDDKLDNIMKHQPAELRILSAIDNKNYSLLYEFAINSGMSMDLLTEYRAKDLIYQEALIMLYKSMLPEGSIKSDGEIIALFKAAVKHGVLKGQPPSIKMYHNNKWAITAHGFSSTCEPTTSQESDGLDI